MPRVCPSTTTTAEAKAIADDLGELALGAIPVKGCWAVRFWESNRGAVLARLEPEALTDTSLPTKITN